MTPVIQIGHHRRPHAARGDGRPSLPVETFIVKFRPIVAAALACVLSVLFSGAADAAGKPRTPRGELVRQIVLKWGVHVQRVYGADVHEWATDMGPIFAKASLGSLGVAAKAPTFEAMNNAFLVDSRGRTASGNLIAAVNKGTLRRPTKALGEIANDLVFVPVTPCRIIDTRIAGGVIPANGTRSFDVSETTNYATQGGDTTDCGVGAAGPFAAAVINFTVVTPTAAGYVTAYPFGTTKPLAATLNYTAGDIRGNLAVVKLNQDDASQDLSVFSYADTHLVADLVGYYIHPQATALDCMEVSSLPSIINAGSVGTVVSPTCPSGYVMTGGGCSISDFNGRTVSSRMLADAEVHFCSFANQGTAANEGVAYGRCCRTPGRP